MYTQNFPSPLNGVCAHRAAWKQQHHPQWYLPPAQLLWLSLTKKTLLGKSCFKITPAARK